MKVRESQIPEESSKPKFEKKRRTFTPIPDEVYSDSEDDDEKPEEEEKRLLSKVMINFEDEGITMTAWELSSLEKDMRFVEKPKAHWEFGIAINRGLTAGQFINKTDVYLWYNSEEVRDAHYQNILRTLEENGIRVISV